MVMREEEYPSYAEKEGGNTRNPLTSYSHPKQRRDL